MRLFLLLGLLGCTQPHDSLSTPPPPELRPLTLEVDRDGSFNVRLTASGLLPFEELSIAHAPGVLGETPCATAFDGGCVDIIPVGTLRTVQSRVAADADGRFVWNERTRIGWYQAIASRTAQTAISNPVYWDPNHCPPDQASANTVQPYPLHDGVPLNNLHLCSTDRFTIEVPAGQLLAVRVSDGVGHPVLSEVGGQQLGIGHWHNDTGLPVEVEVRLDANPRGTPVAYDLEASLLPYRPCQPTAEASASVVPRRHEGMLCTGEVVQHTVETVAGDKTWVRVDAEHPSIWAQVRVEGRWVDIPEVGLLMASERPMQTRIGAGPIATDLRTDLSLSYRLSVLGEDMCRDDDLDNHTPADAAALPVAGELCGEPDWFELPDAPGDRVTLDMEGDSRMTVFDAGGTTLVEGGGLLQFIAPPGGAWLRVDALDGREHWGTPYAVAVHHEPPRPCSVDRHEPNDDVATLMEDGVPLAGSACEGDVDRYEFFVAEGAPRLSLTPDDGDRFDLQVVVDGETVGDLDPDPHVFEPAEPAVGWWQATVRPVELRSYGGYLLGTRQGCSHDRFEPDGPGASASPGRAGPVFGTLCGGDHDRFSWFVWQGQRLQATLQTDTPALFRILDHDVRASQNTGSATLSWVAPANGTYMVDVVQTGEDASYTLDMQVYDPVTGPCIDDGANRADLARAWPLEPGERIHAIACPGRDDWFRTEWPLASTGEWIVRPTDGGVVDLHLYDASGRWLSTERSISAVRTVPLSRWVQDETDQVSFVRVEHRDSDPLRPGVRLEIAPRSLDVCPTDPWEPNDSLGQARALPASLGAMACMDSWDVYTIDVDLYDELSIDIRGSVPYSLYEDFAPVEYRIEMDGELLIGPRLARVSAPNCVFCTDWAGVLTDAPGPGTMSVWIRSMEGAAYSAGQPYTVDFHKEDCPPDGQVSWTDPTTPQRLNEPHHDLSGTLCGSTSHHFVVDADVGDRLVVNHTWNSTAITTITEPDGTIHTTGTQLVGREFDFDVVDAGAYHIQLSRLWDYRFYSSISIDHLEACEPDAYEPDEPIFLAPDAVGTQHRTLCPDDRDYLALSIDAGQTADITVAVPQGEGRVQVDLIDASGQLQPLLTIPDGVQTATLSSRTPLHGYLMLTMLTESTRTGRQVGTSAIVDVDVY